MHVINGASAAVSYYAGVEFVGNIPAELLYRKMQVSWEQNIS